MKPTKVERKTAQIVLRIEPSKMALLEKLAKANKVQVSEFIRWLIDTHEVIESMRNKDEKR
jgi:uncharacterized protein (DUF1778 family)